MRMALVVGAVLALAQPAMAGNCSDLPNPIYLQVGATQHNLMQSLGIKLRDNTAKPITLVWIEAGSCPNIDLIYHHNPANGITKPMNYIPPVSENPNYTPSTTPPTCTPPAAPFFPDIGNSALFNSACTAENPPANVTLTEGPKQSYVLAMVRGATTTTAITAEEAYFIFGFGPTLLASMNAAIMPWVDQMQLYILPTTKSTLLAWAFNLGIPAAKMKGNGFKADGTTPLDIPDIAPALLASPNPSAAMGIMGGEVYDAQRDKLTIMAFRAYHQYAAYYPDSTATARDKKNLRDGHYTVWSPTIWMQFVDGTNTPVKADADYVIGLIAGHDVTPAPNFAADEIVARVGLVPDCAMRVARDQEGGPLHLYKPTTSCVCAYEATVATTSCQVCSATAACASGVCRNGFCEEY
ncbi:MAG: hypothetical protein QM831_06990 [Kofleriaceae bacterium]